ncbi:uncharacterized protein BO80DRAFT_429007 [Aspergillus ibericus CBS 121593]|uniref:Nephrocystin 3-like N-terminal domain-containing protein n=1 Tax=Aspergillus ibericus CBS 121593 TaxID=1448316 RepID=A0A395GNR2_9EURO|nr:hypothetical protein BO80DRAFT_429007 [Aspergillus ibericus CBS 121593]RAK96588.1 hypothetical protein BO80DRAFT_429007 [Aspergillus ibericus CBS 121593]
MDALRGTAKDHKKQLVTVFVRERASEYHDAFGIASPTTSSVGLEETTLPASRDLEEALEAYNATADPESRFDVHHCTWERVVDELNGAEERYVQQGQGYLHFVRKGFRIAGDYSSAITPWLGLIPSSNGLELLSAGLTVIFSIAKQNSDNRGKILNAFHSIPAIILRTEEQQNQFATVQVLREKAVDLYRVLIRALAELIFLFGGNRAGASLKTRAKRMGKRLIAPAYTASQIDEILSTVQRSTEEFEACRDMVKSQVLIDIHHSTTALQAQTESIHDRTQQISYGVDDLNYSAQQTHIQLDGVQGQLSDLVAQVEAVRAEQYSMYQPGMDAQAALCHFLLHDFPGFWNAITSGSIPMPQSQSFLSRMELFHCMGVSPRGALDDINVVLKQHSACTPEVQAQSQQLLSSDEFSRWMQSTHAETLFVQGNASTIGPGRVSPLSALCATLSLNFSRNSNAIVLHFFCGVHDAPYDPVAGPKGLIRSLIAQLLLTRSMFNLDFINTRSFKELIESHSLFELCHTFRQLVEQLPTTATVVCIIDGVAQFESAAWLADLLEVIHTMNQTIHNPALHPIVKLLITTPFVQSGHTGGAIMAHYWVTLRNLGGTRPIMSDRSLLSNMGRLEEYRMKMQNSRRGGEAEDDSDDDF